jgi:eukaryotic-like serine/threonine-protein kinase
MADTATGKSAQQPFLIYLNFDRGIKIAYPAGWTKQEQGVPAMFFVGFASPQEDPSDVFSENLNIVIEPLPPGMTLAQYVQGCLQGMSQSPFQYLEKGPATVSGRPAYRHVYTGPLPAPVPLSGKVMQYFIVANSKGYVITYTAELQKFDRFLPVIQQMADSLEIK